MSFRKTDRRERDNSNNNEKYATYNLELLNVGTAQLAEELKDALVCTAVVEFLVDTTNVQRC